MFNRRSFVKRAVATVALAVMPIAAMRSRRDESQWFIDDGDDTSKIRELRDHLNQMEYSGPPPQLVIGPETLDLLVREGIIKL